MLKFTVAAGAALVLTAWAVPAEARNPGFRGMHCVSERVEQGKVHVTNTCKEPVFIVWCGELTYNSKRCGDGPNGAFYTHSMNLKPGVVGYSFDVKGRYRLDACMGTIGFGNEGHYRELAGGTVECLQK